MGKLTPEQAAKNRERQRRWRERAFKDPDGHLLSRVNVALGSHAAASLKRLSEGYSLTHRELFERLLIAANTAVSESLRGKGAWRFADGKLEPGALGTFDLIVVQRAPVPSAALPDNAPALSLEPSPPPRSDADLVGVLWVHHNNSYSAVARAMAEAGHKVDRSNLSRIHRDGQTASPETRAALVALVAECEREGVE